MSNLTLNELSIVVDDPNGPVAEQKNYTIKNAVASNILLTIEPVKSGAIVVEYTLIATSFGFSPVVSPTPTITLTPTVTNTSTPTKTATPTVTRTVTGTPAVTTTISNTPTVTPTKTITPTLTATITLTPSVTPTITITPSPSGTPGVTVSNTITPTVTRTPSVTPTITTTRTPTHTVTTTATVSQTPLSTRTATPTPSVTPSAPAEAGIYVVTGIAAYEIDNYLMPTIQGTLTNVIVSDDQLSHAFSVTSANDIIMTVTNGTGSVLRWHLVAKIITASV